MIDPWGRSCTAFSGCSVYCIPQQAKYLSRPCGKLERGITLPTLNASVCAAPYQEFHHSVVKLLRCQVKRRLAPLVLCVHIGTVLKQDFGYCVVGHLGRQV